MSEQGWKEEHKVYWMKRYPDPCDVSYYNTRKMDSEASYLQACKVREEEIERWRTFAWLNHGCSISGLYGDDGEKQCNNTKSHRPIDFVRDSVEAIMNKLQPDYAVVKKIVDQVFGKEAK